MIVLSVARPALAIRNGAGVDQKDLSHKDEGP